LGTNGNVVPLAPTYKEFPLSATLLRILDQLSSVSSHCYPYGGGFLTLGMLRIPDVPGARPHHDGNRWHTDAPLSSRLFLRILRGVRNQGFHVPEGQAGTYHIGLTQPDGPQRWHDLRAAPRTADEPS